MARGTNGKIFVEIDPDLKYRLGVKLTRDKSTLKNWVRRKAIEDTKDVPVKTADLLSAVAGLLSTAVDLLSTAQKTGGTAGAVAGCSTDHGKQPEANGGGKTARKSRKSKY
jgi:hypothetical protein